MIELSRLRGSERYAACSDDVMAHLPSGSAQKGCICLPYTAPELSAGLSLSKALSQGVERENTPQGWLTQAVP